MSLSTINTLTTEAMANYVVTTILATSSRKLALGEPFTLALAGGTTPKRVYQKLKQHSQCMQHWHILYSDERFLNKKEADRNETLFLSSFGSLPEGIQHTPYLSANTNSLHDAQAHYIDCLNRINSIDICLLGVGEDGHSASLFPNNLEKDKNNPSPIITIDNSPKPPAQRLSFNYNLIEQCRHVVCLASGASKNTALQQALIEKDTRLPIHYLFSQAELNSQQHFELLADAPACQNMEPLFSPAHFA